MNYFCLTEMVCFRSEFACRIGGNIFTQSSAIGFSIRRKENQRNNLPGLESTASTPPAPESIDIMVPHNNQANSNQPDCISDELKNPQIEGG